MDTDLAFSRGFDAGNFAGAYEGGELSPSRVEAKAKARGIPYTPETMGAFRAGFVLGFFASYETREVPAKHRALVERLRAQYPDHA